MMIERKALRGFLRPPEPPKGFYMLVVVLWGLIGLLWAVAGI